MVRIAPTTPEARDQPLSRQPPPATGGLVGDSSTTILDGKEQLAAILSVINADTPGSHILFGMMGRVFTVGGLRSLRDYLLDAEPQK